MSLHYADVTAKGTRVHGDGLRELYLSAEDWTDGLAEAFKGLDDVAYLRHNGTTEVLGPTGGDYNVLVTPDGDVFWVTPDCAHYRQRGVAVIFPIPIGPTTQGMAYWDEGTRSIVWMDTVLQRPRPIVRAFRQGGYTFGLDPDADRVLAQKLDGSLWVVASVYTPVGCRGRLTPQGAVCAISLPKDQATYFVPESEWQRWTAAPSTEPPSPPVPDPPPVPVPVPVPEPEPQPEPPPPAPEPKPKPWWVRLIEALLKAWGSK